MNTKICSHCNVLKPFNREYFGKETKNKHGLSGVCLICKKIQIKTRNEYLKLQEKPILQSLACTVCKYSKPATLEFFHKHSRSKTGFKDACKECRKIETHKYNTSDECRAKARKRRKEDVSWKMRKNISIAICNSLKKSGSSKKQHSCFDTLGYSIEELKAHLETYFEPWMNWDNWGQVSTEKRTWNIDHIYPQSKLPYDNLQHPNFKKCWALENLRPLCAIDNIRKKDKII